MTKKELETLTIDELKELAMKKGRKGNATSDALQAQKLLHDMTGNGFNSHISNSAYGSKRFDSGTRTSHGV